MTLPQTTLRGAHVRLEPLEERHVAGLARAGASDRALYALTFVPGDLAQAQAYVASALADRDAGEAMPFATVDVATGDAIGSTRFFAFERWPGPKNPAARPQRPFDACEIGYTWLAAYAVRTAANTEAKLLMLAHAFEEWHVERVCLHTDERNARSRAAIERLGARLDGVLRAHRWDVEDRPRNSARYSILASEWPEVKARLENALTQRT